jgi:biopolymer transport protein ExbD
LKSIAATAPFLGLAGTCYGILVVFSTGYSGSKSSFLALILLEVATTLTATVAGLIVAIPAAVSYNVLRNCLEKFESKRATMLLDAAPRSYGFAQTLPLRRRFSSFPAFALIGAPVLGILVPMFALMLRAAIPVGLPVYVTEIGVSDQNSPPIIVSVIATSRSGRPLLYVNSKETSWEELGNKLQSRLDVRPRRRVYVEGGDDVEWAYVADAIDVARGLHAEVVLLPATSNIESGQARGAKTKRAKAQ